MCARKLSLRSLTATGALLVSVTFPGCSSPADSESVAAQAPPAAQSQQPAQQKGGQDVYGPYEVVANWLQRLPDESKATAEGLHRVLAVGLFGQACVVKPGWPITIEAACPLVKPVPFRNSRTLLSL